MNLNLIKKSKRFRQDAGIALLTTILLLFLMSSLLVGFSLLLLSNQQLAGANNDQVVAFYAAEAGMEKMTADLGNLFALTYSPSIGQINALETSPYGPPQTSLFTALNPSESVSYITGDGNPGYTIVPAATDTNGNPAPTITTIKSGPYQGMTAMATEYTLTVNARTNTGREVNLIRTTQTVGIPMFQFGIFANTDLDFFPGPTFNFGGRTHTNGNLWLAGQSTLTLSDKVDAYKDVLRTRLENGYATGGTAYASGTIDIATQPCTQPCTPNVRALAMTEGSLTGTVAPYDTPVRNTNWGTISQTDYNSNLRNGAGSAFPQYSTGASQLNLAVVTIGGGSTQSIDLIRRPYGTAEPSNVTNERYFAQASLRILLSDNPADIMNLPCVDQTTQPFDLSMMAMAPGLNGANWLAATAPASLQALAKQMIADGTVILPLATSASAQGTTYSSAAADGYWLPPTTNVYGAGNKNYFPIIKGYIKIEEQLAPYPTSGCTSADQKDVTIEVLALGYVGRNINPVSQSITPASAGSTNGKSINPAWPGLGTALCANATSCTEMDPLSSGTTAEYTLSPYNGVPPNELTTIAAGYSYPLPTLPTAAVGYQNAGAMAAGSYTGQTGSCMDPHPNAIIRLERIRDNPSSLYAAHFKNASNNWVNYVANGVFSTGANPPMVAPVAVVCGVDPTTKTLPVIADTTGITAMWTPEPWDFWPNTLFDTREGTLRDEATPAPVLPTLNGTMHYIELDAHNVAQFFRGTVGTVATSGGNTKDSVVAPDNFLVYISDRRGNYDNSVALASWPPTSPSGFETGEYGWNDLVNSSTDQNGCPDNVLETGEDPDTMSLLYTYGANAKYIHGGGLGLTTSAVLGNGQYGIFASLAGAAHTFGVTATGTNCTTTPTYSNTTNSDGIWPMMVPGYVYGLANGNALRENPPLFFRRAVKIVDGADLTPVGACPSNVNCGLSIAVENPVYIQGDYNANANNNGWSSTEIASSVAGDAVTLLSDQWNDVNSFAGPYNLGLRAGNTTWYRTAIVGGATVPFTQPTFSGVSADYGTDGGVHNFLRYIEAWGGTLNYNGSIVDLYTSRQANGTFKCCTTVYSPPTRGYNFDTSFLNPTLLPPRTPLFRTVSTTGWTRVLAPQSNSYK
jgi:Tfp pilus assembly protein PilX